MRVVLGAAEPGVLDNALLQPYANSAPSSSGLTLDLAVYEGLVTRSTEAR